MDINLHELPQVVYACFVLHNFCEMNGETVNDEAVRSNITCHRDNQPQTARNRYTTDTNETEGKRVRRVLTKYFDPEYTCT